MPSANRGLNEVSQGVTLLNTESNFNNTERLSSRKEDSSNSIFFPNVLNNLTKF